MEGEGRAPRGTAEIAREKSYVRRIEKRFLALRGEGLYLSPRDFALLLDWHDRGVPGDLVIAVLEQRFAKAAAGARTRKILSISYCRHAVEEAWAERRTALVGPAPAQAGTGKGVFTLEEVVSHLAKAAAAFEAAAARAPGGLTPGRSVPSAGPAEGSGGAGGEEQGRDGRGIGPRSASDGLCAIARVLHERRQALLAPPPPDFPALEEQLVELESRALDVVKSTLPAERIEELSRRTEERLAPFTSRMSRKARAATVARAVDSAIRESAELPRLSLFTMAR